MNANTFLVGVLVPFLTSVLLVFLIHPIIDGIAKKYGLVDNPNTRKLQKKPVQVMGGIAVFWGIVIGMGVTSMFFDSFALFTCIMVIMVMLYVGCIDDLHGLSPQVRLLSEVLVVLFIVRMDHVSMNDFQGIFGIGMLPSWAALILSCVAGAGIINSINMIDGVNGLSTGFCILACLVLGCFFLTSFDGTMTVLATVTAGSLVPFFLHNVFGKSSKMFIGDGGTMMMGIIMTVFCMHLISHRSIVAYNYPNVSMVSLCLSVLSVPIFDTLRVMTGRIMKGISPFHPDKSHLHHLFIEIGFSHLGTTCMVLSAECFNLLCWGITAKLDASATVQFVVVCFVGIMTTTGFYYIVRRLNKNSIFYKILHRMAIASNIERGPLFNKMQRLMDKL